MSKKVGFFGALERALQGIKDWADRDGQPKEQKQSASMTASAAGFHWPEHDDCISVVGEQFYQANLKQLVGDHGSKSVRLPITALIAPENDNPHDDKAVGIWIDGYRVGYLDRDDARSFRRRLSAKKLSNQATTCSGVVMGGFIRDNGERASYGVQLFIKPFF
jgi:hypothetical protein